jgi:hypothetical protein
MNAVEFKKILENLEAGDVVTFDFKHMVHWATYFLALFNVHPHAFEVSSKSALDFYTINLYMGAKWISASDWPVICNVLCKLNRVHINIDWVVEYLFPLLRDFTVEKAPKPE